MSEYIYEHKPSGADHMGKPVELPTLVQREEIVRCRDCYFADEIEGGYWCDRFDCGKEHVTSNGFCAWAERKEGGDD